MLLSYRYVVFKCCLITEKAQSANSLAVNLTEIFLNVLETEIIEN